MKKSIRLILSVVMLVILTGSFSVWAEDETQNANTFELPYGLHWGMTLDEVDAIVDLCDNSFDSGGANREYRGYKLADGVGLMPLLADSEPQSCAFYFEYDHLLFIEYGFVLPATAEEYNAGYFSGILGGEAHEITWDEAAAFYRALDEGELSKHEYQYVKTTMKSYDLGDTVVWAASEPNNDGINIGWIIYIDANMFAVE